MNLFDCSTALAIQWKQFLRKGAIIDGYVSTEEQI